MMNFISKGGWLIIVLLLGACAMGTDQSSSQEPFPPAPKAVTNTLPAGKEVTVGLEQAIYVLQNECSGAEDHATVYLIDIGVGIPEGESEASPAVKITFVRSDGRILDHQTIMQGTAFGFYLQCTEEQDPVPYDLGFLRSTTSNTATFYVFDEKQSSRSRWE